VIYDGGVSDVINSEALVERFGEWPSFHDAEIQSLRLDSGQRGGGVPTLELEIHVFAAGPHDPKHSLATFLFERVEEVKLDGFGPQNVIDELVFDAASTIHGPRVRVFLPSNNGLDGSFLCETVIVLSVAPFVPGEHSVYGR
jgi:hypothetical protein